MWSNNGTDWVNQEGFTPWDDLDDSYSDTAYSIEVNVVVTGITPDPTSDTIFVIVPTNAPTPVNTQDASADIEGFINSFIGMGVCCDASDNVLFVDYWGNESQVADAELYREQFNENGIFYSTIPGASVSILQNEVE